MTRRLIYQNLKVKIIINGIGVNFQIPVGSKDKITNAILDSSELDISCFRALATGHCCSLYVALNVRRLLSLCVKNFRGY